MGGFVLAMTLVATYTSAGSFIGGPGLAFSKGLSWVYLAMIQVPTAFLILGVLGKKFAVISRKIDALTINDFLRARYNSPAVVILASIALVVFFSAMMVAQFIGGAALFESITGFSYPVSLMIFALVVIFYTSFGGFRAVVITDTLQGIVMVIGTILILISIITAGGGFESLILKLDQVNPTWNEPTAGGSLGKSFVLSFWILVGLGVLGIPQTAVRAMGFKDTRSLHKAMIYSTLVVGFLMLGMHLAGVFAVAILPPDTKADMVVPLVVTEVMHPLLAGLFIAAPLAAVMSTVSSLLLLSSAAIVKDLYLNYLVKNRVKVSLEKRISVLSMMTTAVMGIIVFYIALQPPGLIVWINLFAFGGLEAAFLAPIIFGLYWKKANALGAILSFVSGVGSYILFREAGISLWGTHIIFPVILISIGCFVLGSMGANALGFKTDQKTLEIFFPSD